MTGAIMRFDADQAKSGAVSKDGAFACIEFAAGEERLWVTQSQLVPTLLSRWMNSLS